MSSRIVEQVGQLLVKRISCFLGPLLPFATQSLQEAFALGEALELVDTLVSFANAVLSSEIDFSWVDRRHLQVNHTLTEVSQQVECRGKPCHQVRLVL